MPENAAWLQNIRIKKIRAQLSGRLLIEVEFPLLLIGCPLDVSAADHREKYYTANCISTSKWKQKKSSRYFVGGLLSAISNRGISLRVGLDFFQQHTSWKHIRNNWQIRAVACCIKSEIKFITPKAALCCDIFSLNMPLQCLIRRCGHQPVELGVPGEAVLEGHNVDGAAACRHIGNIAQLGVRDIQKLYQLVPAGVGLVQYNQELRVCQLRRAVPNRSSS